ncbi:MAG: translation elongation factor Ts [Candidatus Margulisbacteria bacterium]|nr:translation elongation factor Ts [Candidatus Margulisiibacteriota bacterium]
MSQISSQMVQNLREKTSAGMMECKKALVEAKGDMDNAIKILREKGLASASKRAGRAASKGSIESYIHMNGAIGVIVEVNCETDFVAKTAEFKALVKDIAMHIAAANPQYVVREEVPADIINKEKDIIKQQLMNDEKNQKKPAQIIDKIIEGRLEKFYSEVCLLDQPFIRDTDKSVSELVKEAIAKIGENIVIRRFARFQLGSES